MSEDSLSERLKWIRDEYFNGVQKSMAEAMDCEPSYITTLISGERKNLGRSLAVNLVNHLPAKSGVTLQWLLFGGERTIPKASSLTATHPDQDHLPNTVDALEWILENSTEETIDTFVAEAMKQKRRDIARVILEAAERVASSAQDVADAVASVSVAEQLSKPAPGLPLKPGAGAPSARKPSPSGGASRESTAPPATPGKVPK